MNLTLKFSAFALAVSSVLVQSASIPVPNSSFEAPPVPNTVPALPFFDAWQHTPKPDWYVEDPSEPQSQWANLAGVFPNPAPGQPGRLENADGAQAGYIFGVPSNGIFQDLNATFEIAQSYRLTVALAPSASIPPTPGSTIAVSLFYRDDSNQILPVASATAVYNTNNFPSLTNFVDFTVETGTATRASDPWVGKTIGVMLVSSATQETSGGIWDIENVRLAAISVPSGSFEAPEVPTTVPALPFFVDWQHTPKPEWYVEDPNAPETAWANLAGVFPNPAPGTEGSILNLEEKQAAYLFAVPSNGIFQQTTAVYEPGVTYNLSLGLVGSSSFAPPEGTALSVALYYQDAQTNVVPIASREIVYTVTNFPSLTNLVYYSVSAGPLTNNHPAIGAKIGVSITSTVAPSGGIWDIDDVHLTASILRLNVSRLENKLHLIWPSQGGVTLETSQDFINWSPVTSSVVNTGAETTTDIPIDAQASRAFFRLRLAP